MKKALLFILAMIMLMIPMSVMAQDVDSNLSITASSDEVAVGEEFSLRISAPGADAIRVWNDKNERLKELHLPKGGGSASLKFTVDEPGTAVYYLTALYNGVWSEKPSSRVSVIVKGPQDAESPAAEPETDTPEPEEIIPEPETVESAPDENTDSSLSITASKSEVLINEEFELKISAPGADAVRLWDGRRDTQIKEIPFSGMQGFTLSTTVPVPGTAIYYLTAAYNGVWSEERSSRVMVTAKAPKESNRPYVVPAKSESEFWGTWKAEYAGVPGKDGEYQIYGLDMSNDASFMFSPGFMTFDVDGEVRSSETSFEDGILFTKQGTYEMTNIGSLSNYTSQGYIFYLEKVSDEYPSEPVKSEPETTADEPGPAEENEEYSGRSATLELPETVPAAGENEFLGTWEMCYLYMPESLPDKIINTDLLGLNTVISYYITPGKAEYSESSSGMKTYISRFADGRLDLGDAQLSMNDNGMISEDRKSGALYFCKVSGTDEKTEAPSSEPISNNSGNVVLTVTPTEGVAGQKLHFHAEAPGAESITLYLYESSKIRELEGDVFDFDYTCLNYGDVEFSAVASYKGGADKKTSNKVVVKLEQKTSGGTVYKYLNSTSLPAANKFTVDMPTVVAANEPFRITINPQTGINDFMVSLIETKGNPLFLDEILKAGTLEFNPLPAGSYIFMVLANGGSYDNVDINFEVREGVQTEASLRFAPGSGT